MFRLRSCPDITFVLLIGFLALPILGITYLPFFAQSTTRLCVKVLDAGSLLIFFSLFQFFATFSIHGRLKFNFFLIKITRLSFQTSVVLLENEALNLIVEIITKKLLISKSFLLQKLLKRAKLLFFIAKLMN